MNEDRTVPGFPGSNWCSRTGYSIPVWLYTIFIYVNLRSLPTDPANIKFPGKCGGRGSLELPAPSQHRPPLFPGRSCSYHSGKSPGFSAAGSASGCLHLLGKKPRRSVLRNKLLMGLWCAEGRQAGWLFPYRPRQKVDATGCALKSGEEIKEGTCRGTGGRDGRGEARLDPGRRLRRSEAARCGLACRQGSTGRDGPFLRVSGFTSSFHRGSPGAGGAAAPPSTGIPSSRRAAGTGRSSLRALGDAAAPGSLILASPSSPEVPRGSSRSGSQLPRRSRQPAITRRLHVGGKLQTSVENSNTPGTNNDKRNNNDNNDNAFPYIKTQKINILLHPLPFWSPDLWNALSFQSVLELGVVDRQGRDAIRCSSPLRSIGIALWGLFPDRSVSAWTGPVVTLQRVGAEG
ncbi:uncharacterized protein [Pithys albifrons albifrons]|uniref:uncharacterized protein n=1 Tax=Pithys albifrons albifrons TaxID=3385563 RepID=UPI003A5CD743